MPKMFEESSNKKVGKSNVLIISLHADPIEPSGSGEGGGTHSYIRELLRRLAYESRYASVVTRHIDIKLPVFQRLSDYTSIYRIKLGKIEPMDKRFLNKYHDLSVQLIKEIIKELHWKVNILQGVYWYSGYTAMTLSKELSIPFVQTVISNGKRKRSEGCLDDDTERILVEKEIYDNASAIFCISGEEKKDLRELYKIDSSKLVVVGRPVPLPFLEYIYNSDKTPRYINLINHIN
ncbi:glycosyltransferase [Rhodohalobacter sp. 614A]|uniref:glycosyltransferase n=1 Tax=Rhodohalobacter sp. 614A TaxID=2908649 RepID=UPI001F3A9D09|nr:glycosyltransferase [Rhodohalobacter sp. 614A]